MFIILQAIRYKKKHYDFLNFFQQVVDWIKVKYKFLNRTHRPMRKQDEVLRKDACGFLIKLL